MARHTVTVEEVEEFISQPHRVTVAAQRGAGENKSLEVHYWIDEHGIAARWYVYNQTYINMATASMENAIERYNAL